MARSAIAWSSGTRTLEYSGNTTPGRVDKGEKIPSFVNHHFILCLPLPLCVRALTEILTELIHYFIKHNAVLKALQSMNGLVSLFDSFGPFPA